MLNQIINAAYEEALNKVESDRPTLFILRGFSEVISKNKPPSAMEVFDHEDLEGNTPRFILAEMFQILSIDQEIYEEVEAYAYFHPSMAQSNIHQDRYLSTVLFSISYLFEETDQSTDIVKKMMEMNYNFIYIDFNLFEHLNLHGSPDFFPINHQPVIHMDMEVYTHLKYPGRFFQKFHQIAIVHYMEKTDIIADQIKVFKDNQFLNQMNIDYTALDLYEETTHAFFNYYSIFDTLN